MALNGRDKVNGIGDSMQSSNLQMIAPRASWTDPAELNAEHDIASGYKKEKALRVAPCVFSIDLSLL